MINNTDSKDSIFKSCVPSVLVYFFWNTLQYAGGLPLHSLVALHVKKKKKKAFINMEDVLVFKVFFLNSKFDMGHMASSNTSPLLLLVFGHVLSL